ncbi:hypothetical protein DMENIID0001_076580 [Sergentomyia squamirostris]
MDSEHEPEFKIESVNVEEMLDSEMKVKKEEEADKKVDVKQENKANIVELKKDDEDDEMSEGEEYKPEDSANESVESIESVSDDDEKPRRRGRGRPKKIVVQEDGRKNPLLPLLYCYICQKTYTKAYPMQKHLDEHYSNRRVNNDNPYPCSQCGKIFTAHKFLECHMKTHRVEKKHDCRVCNRRFSSLKILRIHRAGHDKEKKFSCEICCQSFRFQNALTIHVEEHIKKMPFPKELLDLHVIPSIDENTQAPPGINENLLTGGILYKCSQCPQKFATANERRNHQGKDHPKIHTCEFCGKELRSSFSYRLHIVSHTKEKTFKCKQCGEMFHYPNLLVVHRRVAHGTGDPERLYRPFRCEPCGKAYVYKYALTEHINFVHKDQKVICDLCGYAYGTKARLRRHFKRVHLRTKMNEKQKATCGRMVGNRESGKERKCPDCDFIAFKICDLRLHRIKDHFNNLHCDECNITMASILLYRYHMEDHKDGISVVPGPGRHGKIFGCIACDKFYTDRRFLRDHINARHRSIIFKCDHCEMTFQTKRYLVRHLALHHGITNNQPKAKKVDGIKKKAAKKTKIKNFPTGVPSYIYSSRPRSEQQTNSTQQHSYQSDPPQSSPLALQMPHHSPQVIQSPQQHHYKVEPGVPQHVTPPPVQELQQVFKIEQQQQQPHISYVTFGN